MKEILNWKCSVYVNAILNKKADITLREFIYDIGDFMQRSGKIDFLRKIDNDIKQKEFKKNQLLQCFPCCVFGKSRSKDDIIQRNNLLILDIDVQDTNENKENIDLLNLEFKNKVKQEIFNLNYVMFINDSCRGKGFYVGVLVKYTDDERYKQHYYSLSNLLKTRFNLITDNSCKNINRGRFSTTIENLMIKSDDTEIIFYEDLLEQDNNLIRSVNLNISNRPVYIQDKILDDKFIIKCISKLIEDNNYSCSSYYEWLKDGFRLATLGESVGLYLYILLSRYSPSYKNDNDVERQFDICLKNTNLDRSCISYYFKLAKNAYGQNWIKIVSDYDLHI